MSMRYLRLVAKEIQSSRPCGCVPWDSMNGEDRDLTLYSFMRWAWALHHVELVLLARGGRVAVCEIFSVRSGRGRARKVLTELCIWADCAGVVLALTPTDQWGADVERLVRFYVSLGFADNVEPSTPFRVQEKMIRYPIGDGGHER